MGDDPNAHNLEETLDLEECPKKIDQTIWKKINLHVESFVLV